ncbi:hypothetical protein [Glaesserella sp.]|uniref:hypothetical protein n=1 Tax=Glaesserella sp. TaxID=2094731 RepID=UPI0035A1213D
MSHEHDSPSKLEITTYAVLPLASMLFIEMLLNYYAAPQNAIFISPYLLAFFVTCAVCLVVLWKGQICPGQKGRLSFILPWLIVFALGNLLYSLAFTPKHTPATISAVAALLIPFVYWRLPQDEQLYRTMIYCGFGIAAIGVMQYLIVYWIEIPSLFNGIRANNFAQLLFGIVLAGWYLMLAKSRLDGFFKLLVLLALGALVLNYLWTAFVLYQHRQIMPDMPLVSYFVFFAVQFVILGLLAWLLLGKNIKNPIAWTATMFLAMLYPFTNVI